MECHCIYWIMETVPWALGIQYYNPTTSHPEVTSYPPTGDMLTSSVDCAQGTVSIIQYIQWHSRL
jgi:hypothetical protein